jgi:uncharacterized membrane protein
VLVLSVGFILAPDRAWGNLLVVSFGLVGLGLGGAIFLAMHELAGAGWATALRRVPESMFMMLPVGGIGMLLILVFRPAMYPWTNPGPELSHLMGGFKGLWLNRPFFLLRGVIYLVVWYFLARKLVMHSRKQDDGDHRGGNGRTAALFVVVFGVTFCLASFDWIMSLEPEWFSTIFGLYNFSGMFVAALALMTLQSIWLRRRGGFLGVLSGEHLHDLGKLMMAFTTFWAYIHFSQYMLIWYANVPEETGYYILRSDGAWGSLFLLNVAVNWLVPFLVLLPVQAKRSSSVMAKVAALLLVGRWLDLYLMVMPVVSGGRGPQMGIWEIGLFAGAIGLVSLLMVRGLRSAALVPMNDPRLQQSLHYHS